MEATTVRKTLAEVEAEALIDMFPDTLSEVVAKIIADTLTCVEAGPAVRTDPDTLDEVEAEALAYTQAHTFP